jgi:ribosomal protein S17E
LNHTNSFQIRDIKKLSLPDFKESDIKKITEISKNIVKNLKDNLEYNFENNQKQINQIVERYFK